MRFILLLFYCSSLLLSFFFFFFSWLAYMLAARELYYCLFSLYDALYLFIVLAATPNFPLEIQFCIKPVPKWRQLRKIYSAIFFLFLSCMWICALFSLSLSVFWRMQSLRTLNKKIVSMFCMEIYYIQSAASFKTQ